MKSCNLDSPIEELFKLSPLQKAGLRKLGLTTLSDLLFYLPSRYGDVAEVKHIKELMTGELAIVSGRVLKNEIKKGYKTKIPIAEVILEDDTGKIKAVWFHQPYMAKKIKEGSLAKITGTVAERKGEKYIANGEIEEAKEIELAHKSSLFAKGVLKRTPVYPETKGLSSLWFRHAIKKILSHKLHDQITDVIPEEILHKYHLPGIKTALVWIHEPRNDSDALAARKRFSFEEIFFIQLERQSGRREYRANPAFQIQADHNAIDKFLGRFGFDLTKAQRDSINQILKDLALPVPMARLLEGDVGSGKTAVAATISYATINQRPRGQNFGALQVAYMAPTEILAKQHFESFIKYFEHLGVNVGLITGSGCFKFPSKTNPKSHTQISRSQLLKWVGNGDIPILIGTHALIQKSVKFKHLALAIIDEQHRFGVNQRSTLIRRKDAEQTQNSSASVPHLLSMTATPIPRTLALTIYGDLDLSLLDEMPPGRKPVITEIVLPAHREKTYEDIRIKIKEGRQAYIICPRIDEPDPTKEAAINAKSVKEEAKRLKKDIFPEFELGIVHGKMTPKAKDEVMNDFANGKIDILIATSVIEVGVNVPNATIIIIEGAERFGLAQLHQLRGRVIRSTHQAYCYVFSNSTNEKTLARLNALKTAKNGFELAELDLQIRGIGELSGGRQWGVSDIGMEALKNLKMVEAARTEAAEILRNDPHLDAYPLVKERLSLYTKQIHFE